MVVVMVMIVGDGWWLNVVRIGADSKTASMCSYGPMPLYEACTEWNVDLLMFAVHPWLASQLVQAHGWLGHA